jgi:hypothetical protein
MTKKLDMTADIVVAGFLEALLFCSEYADDGYDFSDDTTEEVTAFVLEHLVKFEGIDWGEYGNATDLGQRLYFTSTGYASGFWCGDWEEVGTALDALTERREWDVDLDDDDELELV